MVLLRTFKEYLKDNICSEISIFSIFPIIKFSQCFCLFLFHRETNSHARPLHRNTEICLAHEELTKFVVNSFWLLLFEVIYSNLIRAF